MKTIKMTDVSGIGPAKAKLLQANGIDSVEKLVNTDAVVICEIPGFKQALTTMIQTNAKELLASIESPELTQEPAEEVQQEIQEAPLQQADTIAEQSNDPETSVQAEPEAAESSAATAEKKAKKSKAKKKNKDKTTKNKTSGDKEKGKKSKNKKDAKDKKSSKGKKKESKSSKGKKAKKK